MEKNRSLLSNPKMQVTLALISGLAVYIILTGYLGGADQNQAAIVLDTILFYFWLVFWHFFFSQFVLPVQKLEERWLACDRLFKYLAGRHGPAVLIENGQIRQRKHETQRHKPGIALIDTASAVMLRTDEAYTRPGGPGVVFTGLTQFPHPEYEYLAGVVDLRPQSQALGPKEREDPFQPQYESEKAAAYAERQKRRYQTSGLTRNGIEVVPNILVSFQLNTHPGMGNSQFGYDGPAVRLAVTGEGIDPDLATDDARRSIGWQELPAYLAANIWREALSLFTLDDLFQELDPAYQLPSQSQTEKATDNLQFETLSTGLELINLWVRQRLMQEVVDELGFTGRPTGARIYSPENKILKERGVRVNNVTITNLRFPAAVENELIKRWDSTWYQHAMADRQLLEKQLSDTQNHSQQSARVEYALAIAQRLKKLPPGIEHSSDEILSEMVAGSLQLIVRDANMQKRAGFERNALLDLISSLQNESLTR